MRFKTEHFFINHNPIIEEKEAEYIYKARDAWNLYVPDAIHAVHAGTAWAEMITRMDRNRQQALDGWLYAGGWRYDEFPTFKNIGAEPIK